MDACPDLNGVVNPAIAGSIFQRSQVLCEKCRIETIFRTFHLRYWPRNNSHSVQLYEAVGFAIG